jgi:hypothetical protein
MRDREKIVAALRALDHHLPEEGRVGAVEPECDGVPIIEWDDEATHWRAALLWTLGVEAPYDDLEAMFFWEIESGKTAEEAIRDFEVASAWSRIESKCQNSGVGEHEEAHHHRRVRVCAGRSGGSIE